MTGRRGEMPAFGRVLIGASLVAALTLLGACGSGPDVVVQPAQVAQMPPVVYPAAARRAGEQGTVTLRVQALASGAAGSIEVKTSSGSSRLDAAAVESARKMRFSPARTKSGKAADSFAIVPFNFKLE